MTQITRYPSRTERADFIAQADACNDYDEYTRLNTLIHSYTAESRTFKMRNALQDAYHRTAPWLQSERTK